MTSWLARVAGDIIRHTSLTFSDLAELTDEQILILAASAKREQDEYEGHSSNHGRRTRVENFRSEEELKANYLGLGRLLGLSLDQAEQEWLRCKAEGAEFKG